MLHHLLCPEPSAAEATRALLLGPPGPPALDADATPHRRRGAFGRRAWTRGYAANPTFTGVCKVNLSINYNLGNPGGSQVGVVSASNQGTAGNAITDFTLSYGTGTVLDGNGAVNVNSLYVNNFSLSATTTKSVNLNGGSDTDFVTGAALALTKVKYFLVAMLGLASSSSPTPDGVQVLYVGPQGVANAFSSPWGGSGATVYEQVYWSTQHRGPAAGWTVTPATAMLFNVQNPGASALQTLIVIAGKI